MVSIELYTPPPWTYMSITRQVMRV